MLEQPPQIQPNGRTHFIGLGSAPLSDAVRSQIDAVGHIEWVGNIYAVAAEHTQRRHHYRALLVDLRTLARPELDAILALGRRTGLPVWLLPVDGGRTRVAAALAGGALPWPQMPEQFQKPERHRREISQMPVAVPISKSVPATAATMAAAARFSQILSAEPHFETPQNGHTPMAAHERNLDKAVNGLRENGHVSSIGIKENATVDPVGNQPSITENGIAESKVVESAAPRQTVPASAQSPLRGLPARLFEPAPATSENVKHAEIQQNQVTSPPPPEYDEISPVLSEEELRALLGPPE